jgi:hypothetical protein
MQISREFIEAEMSEVQRELMKAQTFIVQAETSLAIYGMLLDRLDQPEPESGSNLPEASNPRG